MEVLSGKPCWSYASLFIPSSHIPICQSINHCTVFIQQELSAWKWIPFDFLEMLKLLSCGFSTVGVFYHHTWTTIMVPTAVAACAARGDGGSPTGISLFCANKDKKHLHNHTNKDQKNSTSCSTKPQEQRTRFTLIYDCNKSRKIFSTTFLQ